MRLTSSYMENLWAHGGPFIGPDRSDARITVEKDWRLNLIYNAITNDATKLPFRWFQRADNSQVETEIPNVKSVAWDRSIDSDAASCTIELYNQKMDPNLTGQNKRLGTRGYYTWRERGMNARTRWPENTHNEWTDVIIPNALIRTYEGFGGRGKTLTQALVDGNLFVTGVWLVDEVRTGSDGNIQIQCRDMCKLLLEQQLYVPLMPTVKYPVTYQRWRYEIVDYPSVPYYDRIDPPSPDGPFFGPGLEGRKWVPDFGIDADGVGYAILGTDGGVFTYETPFYGSRGEGLVGNVVGMAKRPANDGYWGVDSSGHVYAVGSAVHLGDASDVISPVVGITSTLTGNGYWLLDKSGDVTPFGDAGYLGGSPEGEFVFIDMDRSSDSLGYWLLSETGQVYAYGTATYHDNAPLPTGVKAVGIAGKSTDGYWVAAANGAVYARGSAVHYGNAVGPSAPIVDIVATSTGLGYWLLGQDGGVFAFGDAGFFGALPPAGTAITGMDATAAGYWLVASNGAVYAYGDANTYGGINAGVDPTPMRGIAMDPLGRGYWLTAQDGAVYAFGESKFYGRAINPNTAVVRIVATVTGRGYWLLSQDGGVFAYGDATFYGSAQPFLVGTAVDMARTPSGHGYWILSDNGNIYAFGDASYAGGAPVTSPDKAAGIAFCATGGYWVVSANGGRFALGGAPVLQPNGDWPAAQASLADPITSIEGSPSGNGYLILAGDGGVFSFGDAPFEGSLPTPYTITRQFEGNYQDLSDIIVDLLAWSGWWLYGANRIHGNIEPTGTFVTNDLMPDVFDKKPVIDAINAIRDIIGFEFWIDEEGAARFEQPNWYVYGNWLSESGLHIGGIPEIFDDVTLTSYTLAYADRPIRSEIIITSDDPIQGNATTITTRRVITSDLIRGMVKPAMIATPINVTKHDQEVMAELIEQHMHFQTLQGNVTCVANPAFQIGDQVRIYEQVTGESDVHYIRGISSQHDMETGVWTYSLTTNHLGPGRTAANNGVILAVPETV